MGLLDKVQDKVNDQLHKRDQQKQAETHYNTQSGTHGQGLVPGSQANNPNSIPTAGGQQVGGNTTYNEPGMNAGHNNPNVGYNNSNVAGGNYDNAGVHQTAGDKMQNALPGQHGNAHDAHGNSVDLAPGHKTHGTHAGGVAGTHNTHNSGMAGTHSTHNTHDNYNGPDNRGMMDKAKDALSSNRSNQPDDPITGTNYDQNNRNTHGNAAYGTTGTGIAGSNTHHQGGGLTGSSTQHQSGPGFASSNTHSTHGVHDQHHNAGADNRGMMDKAKDALSSNRSNHPDDPVTGTNYDQNNRNTYNNDSYNNTSTGLTGSNTHHQSGPGFAGSNTHTTHHQGEPNFAGSNTHSTHGAHESHHNAGPDNRGMMDKAKDALSSKRSNHPDDPVTGTNYDQTSRPAHSGGVTGSNDPYNQHGSGLHGNTHAGVVGSSDPYNQTGTGIHGSTTHNTTPGVAGSNVHSTHDTHGTHGKDNRGMMDKAKDMLSSKRSNHPDDPVTGTNYDQKNTAGVHGTAVHGQPGPGQYDGRPTNY